MLTDGDLAGVTVVVGGVFLLVSLPITCWALGRGFRYGRTGRRRELMQGAGRVSGLLLALGVGVPVGLLVGPVTGYAVGLLVPNLLAAYLLRGPREDTLPQFRDPVR